MDRQQRHQMYVGGRAISISASRHTPPTLDETPSREPEVELQPSLPSPPALARSSIKLAFSGGVSHPRRQPRGTLSKASSSPWVNPPDPRVSGWRPLDKPEDVQGKRGPGGAHEAGSLERNVCPPAHARETWTGIVFHLPATSVSSINLASQEGLTPRLAGKRQRQHTVGHGHFVNLGMVTVVMRHGAARRKTNGDPNE